MTLSALFESLYRSQLLSNRLHLFLCSSDLFHWGLPWSPPEALWTQWGGRPESPGPARSGQTPWGRGTPAPAELSHTCHILGAAWGLAWTDSVSRLLLWIISHHCRILDSDWSIIGNLCLSTELHIKWTIPGCHAFYFFFLFFIIMLQ